jgi:predicted nicotinamide N-methyase
MNPDYPAIRPPLPATPLDALGPLIREHVFVEDRTFMIARPGESDRLLDHPSVRSAFAVDEYMPYWADLWPAARMLAKAILRESSTLPSPKLGEGRVEALRALEVGCGLGLPGITALAMGMHVTLSDYDATALRFAADNARANGFHAFDTLQMDWRYPPDNLQFPLILASDLIYEMRNVAPLVALIQKMLERGGVCLLTDQDRVPSHVLRDTLTAEGLSFTTKIMRAGEPGGRRLKGTLYRISRSA